MGDAVIIFLMEGDSFDIVKQTQQMGLNGMGVRSLAKDLQEGRIRDKEETRKDESLLLKVASEGLLAELQLLQEVRQQLAKGLISNTTLDHIGYFMCLSENLHPRFVNVLETLGLL